MIERGFCTSKDFLGPLKTYGLADRAIWLDGRGAETLDWCIQSFRERAGRLLVAPDLRVFGDARRQIAAVMARLERARIRVVDIIHPQDDTIADMMQRAAVLIQGTGFADRRMARRRGQRGGLAKGDAAAARRATIAEDWVVRNVVDMVTAGKLRWDDAVAIFDGKISESTMRRRFRGAT